MSVHSLSGPTCRNDLTCTVTVFAGLLFVAAAFYGAETTSTSSSSLPAEDVKVAVNEASFLPLDQDWVPVDCKKNDSARLRQCRKQRGITPSAGSVRAGLFAHAQQ